MHSADVGGAGRAAATHTADSTCRIGRASQTTPCPQPHPRTRTRTRARHAHTHTHMAHQITNKTPRASSIKSPTAPVGPVAPLLSLSTLPSPSPLRPLPIRLSVPGAMCPTHVPPQRYQTLCAYSVQVHAWSRQQCLWLSLHRAGCRHSTLPRPPSVCPGATNVHYITAHRGLDVR